MLDFHTESTSNLWAKLSGLFPTFGFTSCTVDLTMLMKKTKSGLTILVVYIDDILLTGSDDTGIHSSLTYL